MSLETMTRKRTSAGAGGQGDGVGLLDAIIGLAARLFTWLFYRVRSIGAERVPAHGPAILVFNNTSLIDRWFILGCLKRSAWVYGPRRERWLPVLGDLQRAWSSKAPEDLGDPSTCDGLADEILQSDGVVLIFAQRHVTRMGSLTPFGPELRELLERHPGVPVIPGYIHGTWRSVFSFFRGRFFGQWPRIRSKVVVLFGEPSPTPLSVPRIREGVELLSAEAFEATRYDRRPLHRQFIYTAKKYSRRRSYGDSNTPTMTYGQALMRSVILSRLLKRKLDASQYVGVFLPSSVGGAMANIATTILGKIPVNLNYTVGQDVLDNCIEQAEITQVLTSKAFLAKIDLKPSGELIYLEDLRNELRTTDKLWGVAARILPAWFVDRVLLGLGRHSIDDVATIVFSSGSTGIPKGIILTHHNVACNAEQMVQHSGTTEQDVVLGILPFFHSFGYTVTLWVPPLFGLASVFHFNPLEAEAVAKLARDNKPTLFFATSTFLRTYIRKCQKEDFESLRLLVCGAEKLQPAVAEEFAAKFGIEPCEGYGCTELSPVVAANIPDYQDDEVHQVTLRKGSIGLSLPGMAVSIRHVDTFEPVSVGEEGLLFAKGPNVMQGYLNKPDMTREAIRDGWYNTGDIACKDEDGFIRITDRLARFSKIGGEMVPHGKIEDMMHELMGIKELVCVVVGVPDKRKGERLIVMYTTIPMTVDALWSGLKATGVPSIWLPSKSDFYVVDEFPVLGTGKLDLKGIKRLALEKAGGV